MGINTKGDCAVNLFLEVCKFQEWKAEKIQEGSTPTPDYSIKTEFTEFIAEVKQLNFEYETGKAYSFKLGEKVRKAIEGARKQLQGHNVPTMLVMCDVRRMGFTGFESMVAGMYGDMTILIDKKTGRSGEMFYGRNSKMRTDINTSISAIADICYDCSSGTPLKPYINIYHNMYAENKFKKDSFTDGQGLSQYWFAPKENSASSCLRGEKEMERMITK